jgi:Amt family ammonium transporter
MSERRHWVSRGAITGLWVTVCATQAWAGQPEGSVDSGDVAWILAASALVVGMIIPGLAFYYGGLVRSKNVISTMVQAFAILCVVSVVWLVCGFTLVFGPDRGGVIGGLDWALLMDVGAAPHPVYAPAVPLEAFMLFQLLFAAFTPALIAGAFAERIKFGAMLLFAALWSVLVYTPIAHWLWGNGWLARIGALDFAGGAVVHVSAGFSAVACAMVVGKRRGWRTDYMAPHNQPLIVLGAGLLWLGWFGFNGGSARGANATAVGAVTVTHFTAVSAALAWMLAEWKHRGKPTVLGVASGAVAGLATSTAGAGMLGPLAAVALGIAAGVCSYMAIVWKGKIGYDDTLDVMGTHGVGGMLGMLGVGFFAAHGHPAMQIHAVVATGTFSFLGSYAILKLVDGSIGLRVTQEEESTGLDLTQHNERAYS